VQYLNVSINYYYSDWANLRLVVKLQQMVYLRGVECQNKIDIMIGNFFFITMTQ